ncbi:MAG: gliding motility protein GldC, partial [Bacteroidota bacterium]
VKFPFLFLLPFSFYPTFAKIFRMAKYDIKKKSEITIGIGLDQENMPVQMEWAANDSPTGDVPQPCKAMLLSLFSERDKETLKIDLWTRDMQVREMDRFFYQTLRGMADTYFRATQNKELANQMQQFVFYFGQQTGVIPKQE